MIKTGFAQTDIQPQFQHNVIANGIALDTWNIYGTLSFLDPLLLYKSFLFMRVKIWKSCHDTNKTAMGTQDKRQL